MRGSIGKGLLLLSLILLLFSRCEYKPDMEFDRNIKKPDSAIIGMTLTPSDSVYTFYESGYLAYDLTTFGLPVYSSVFFLGDEKIRESQDTTGTLYFSFESHPPGEYKLTMVVTTGSNSGSLADLLHAEGYVFSKNWKIVFINAEPPQPCEITRIKDTAGSVEIRWEKYNGVAFKEYELFKSSDLNGNVWDERLIQTITDQNITSVFDSTHVGGIAYYKLRIRNAGGYATSYLYVHETNKSALQATWIGGNKVKLTWNPCIFYRNFKNYMITDETFGGNVVYSTDTIGISSFIYDRGVFGGTNKFDMSIEAKTSSYIYNDNNNSTASVNVGLSFPVFKSFNNNQVNNTVYLLNNDFKLTKINASTGQGYGTVSLAYGTGWCSVSPLDDLIIAPASTSFSGYIRIDPSNFFNPETVTMPGSRGPCPETTLSASGTGMAHVEMPQTGYSIYDFQNRTNLFSKTTNELTCGKISPDGNYILTGFSPGSQANCYKITNNDFESIWINPSTPCDFVLNSNMAVLINNQSHLVELRDLGTSQVIHSFSIGQDDQDRDTDPFHPLMLFTTYSGSIDQCKLKVYNYMTGKKVFEITSMNTGWAAFAIQDSTIFSGAGLEINIQ